MKKCLSAVRYGLETLGVSSDKLFHLIETSRGYDGDDYERWLSGKIIEIAEADGVGFSQLLVKKFNILSELAAQDGMEIRAEYLKLFCDEIGCACDDIYTVGFKDYKFFSDEKKLDEFDFFTGVDLDSENAFFTETLPDDLRGEVVGGKAPLLFKFELDGVSKKSELFSDARNRCVSIKYFGSLLLYRMCLLYDVYGSTDFRFGFLCPVEFLYDEGNCDIVRELLSRFKIDGYNISDLNPYFGEYAFCTCRGRKVDEVEDVGILLRGMRIPENGEAELSEKISLYTHTNKKMIDFLKATKCSDKVPYEEKGVLSGWTKGKEKALGYINVGRTLKLSMFPLCENADSCIPIMKSNLLDVIAFYGLRQSNEECGMYTDINMLVSGHSKYTDLVYNSLPLFLFDIGSEWRGYSVKSGDEKRLLKNKFDPFDSPIVKSLLDVAEVHFSFEAKELMSFCRSYYDKLERDRSLMSFSEVRSNVNDEGLDKMYYNALSNLKKYISATYREVC